MSTLKLLAAVVVLSALTGPTMAQQVISEPGYCAFFYPNANCQNKGAGNPYTDSNYQRSVNQGYVAAPGQTVGVARKRTRAPTTRMQ
ncbi:MAG: hypothetical protein ACRED3_00255 [Bradyrhizobium sp.]